MDRRQQLDWVPVHRDQQLEPDLANALPRPLLFAVQLVILERDVRQNELALLPRLELPALLPQSALLNDRHLPRRIHERRDAPARRHQQELAGHRNSRAP